MEFSVAFYPQGPVVLGGDRQPGDLMKKQGHLGSVSLVASQKNKWLSPSSSIPRRPVEDAVPSRCLYNMQKQVSNQETHNFAVIEETLKSIAVRFVEASL